MVLRQFLADVLARAGDACFRTSRKLYVPPSELRANPWFEIKGDRTLRVMYELGPGDTVFDLGGYEGQWASDIFSMYGCTIHVFEPVPQFAADIAKRFARNPKISVHNFGLSNKDQEVRMQLAAASSSMYLKNGDAVDVALIDVASFLSRTGIRRIDLMKINIEGGEYDLLERLISIGAIPFIRNVQIQFHDFVPNARNRMKDVQEVLAQTHRPTYQYEFVWENWEAKRWPPI